MKKGFLFTLCFAFFLCSCNNDTTSLIGSWVVDKVNVAFDEHKNTPEMVKQIGEMEKKNTLLITADSLLTITSNGTTTSGHIRLSENGTLFYNGTYFGQWEEEKIVTSVDTPIGEVIVTYKKVDF